MGLMMRVKREWLLGTAITLLSLALALRQVDISSIIVAFRNTHIGLACLWSARSFLWSWRRQEGTVTLVAPSREVP
jgi:hypothetical protein